MSRKKHLSVAAAALLVAAACGGKPEAVREGEGGASGADAGANPEAGIGGGAIFGTGGGGSSNGGACSATSCRDGGGGTGPDAGPFCGDGVVEPGSEVCDDGNAAPGDGCSATCEREADFVCPKAGDPCVSTVVCSDGKVTGTEQCDDRNAAPGDGCDAKCQLEPGWVCPHVALACVAARCGDSVVAGIEECDDGNDVAKDGCDANCRLEDGFQCAAPGKKCTTTTCGDRKIEGTEQCDDANFDLGDGCAPTCKVEPRCDQGPCVSACGDGIVLGGEKCDDGNRRDGDGCSAACVVETGFTCTQPSLPARVEIPLVVRDMDALDPLPAVNVGPPEDYATANHVDYEIVGSEPSATEDGVGTNARIVRAGAGSSATGRGLDLGQPGETVDVHRMDGTTLATVSLLGKPFYALSRAQCDKTALPSNANSWDKCTKTTMDVDSFASWYVDHDTAGSAVAWPPFLGRHATVLRSLTLLRGAFDEATANFTAGGNGYTYDSRYMAIDGTIPAVIGGSNPPTRTRGFFPIDDLGVTGTDGVVQHDFHFTSEVRFWFQYDSARTPSLQFSGDDDVWVYVNGHLALDIGGIHAREVRIFTIDAANATAWGLAHGNVYEIAVFQAERNQTGSNYWLTLQSFNTSKTVCQSTCGDGTIASDELCDDGPDNQATDPPDYGKCSADCKKRGPNCGDGHVDAGHEACDDGVNTSVYDFDGKGCAPGCVKPPNCGDGKIQSPEACDDGENKGSYGGCADGCKLSARCGDRIVQTGFGEACDDGPRGSATCSAGCRVQGPR